MYYISRGPRIKPGRIIKKCNDCSRTISKCPSAIYICTMEISFSLPDIKEAAQQFLDAAGERKVIALHGEMGAGKTTFVHAVCDVLKVTDTVGSPTFSIINEYSSASGNTIYHLDLYRLKDEQEAIGAGVEECFYSGDLCLAEWPEKAPGLFPDDTLHCWLHIKGNNQRMLQINL